MSTAWKQNSTRAKGWSERGRKIPRKWRMSLAFLRFSHGILFLIMQPQRGDTIGGISQLKLGFVIICGTGEMHVVRGNELTRPFKKKWAENEKQIRVNGWSSQIMGRRGHNEIITSKHCARGATTVLETDYLCWACERGRDTENVKKRGWKELIVRQGDSGSCHTSWI